MVQNEIMIVKCLGCEEPIHPKRLEILPNTKYCVECSDVGRKRGIIVQRGKGDHSYTDVVIMEDHQYSQYIIKNKPMKGFNKAELQDFEEDDSPQDTSSLNPRDIV